MSKKVSKTRFAPYGVATDLPGMLDADEEVIHLFSRRVLFEANLSDGIMTAESGAAGSTVFSLQKNKMPFGTATFGAGATSATILATSITFEAGDKLYIVAPSTQDTTLEHITFAFEGRRD